MKRRPDDAPGLFDEERGPERVARSAPLADRMRPRTLDEVAGQDHLVGPNGILRRALDRRELLSFILWGPPGCGKTTLARIYAAAAGARFMEFSAVLSGVKEIREAVEEARVALKAGRRTVLFVDEIHRFNRAQQDAFLPHVERGTILLIGATTENPSFALNASLLSRARVFTLRPLDETALAGLLARALADRERGLGAEGLSATPEALDAAARAAGGDARVALSLLELAVRTRATARLASPASAPSGAPDAPLSPADIASALQSKSLLYDRAGEEHFNLASALHKSLRSSDPDAALYWLERMLASGEDPHFIARRLVRFASEDVGNADPSALGIALAAWQSFERLGSPEGDLALAQAALYLALAPRSNAVTTASGAARRRIAEGPNPPVPLHIRNAPTALMKDLGYGAGYAYAHDDADAALRQSNLPEALAHERFYEPKPVGFERTLKERLDGIRKLRDAGNRPGTA
ncbi:MAG: replication-associated recombination protein A [bacterium]